MRFTNSSNSNSTSNARRRQPNASEKYSRTIPKFASRRCTANTAADQIDALGEYELTIVDPDGGRTTKSLVASEKIVRRSVVRSSTLFDQLYCPAEPPLEAESPFRRITIDYPETNVSLFGWELQWLWAFLLLTFVFGFALLKPIGVTI